QQQRAPRSGNKRFLADLSDVAAALPSTADARPILGSGDKTDLPNTAAHSWNVDVPDFVPLRPTAGAAAVTSSRQQQPAASSSSMTHQPPPWQQHGNNDPINQLISESLTILSAASVGASSLSGGDDVELNACLMRLYQTTLTRDDPAKVVSAALDCVCPHLISPRTKSPLACNPIYEALLTVCSTENDRIRREIANLRAVSSEQANYIKLFSWLYLNLPSLSSPTQRQGPLMRNTLLFLTQLVNLSGCPLAFKTVHSILSAIGAPLDFDCCDPDFDGGSDVIQLLGDIYDQLRNAAASGRVSLDLIRLLELRAASLMGQSGYQPPSAGSGFPGQQQQQQQYSYTGGEMQNMTDDMYADYEKFLRDSGQL
uniref:MIF4G domain-containing protein n=1 Tax=Macrostomum lignano TaxID=282301 RepID=A0A1I8H7U8_9PLAT